MQQRWDVQQPIDRGQNNGRQDRLRQVVEQAGQEQQAQGERDRGEHEGERRARTRPVVDGGLREAARDRIAVAERRREIGRAEPKQLLAGIERVSVLLRERAGGRHPLDIAEQQTSGGERDDAFHVAQPQRRPREAGQAGRNISRCRDTQRGEAQHGGSENRDRDDGERNRLAGQPAFAQQEQRDRDEADRQDDEIRLA